jgi:hypothetical protein
VIAPIAQCRETFAKHLASLPDVERVGGEWWGENFGDALPDQLRAMSGVTRRALTAVVLLVSLAACGSTPSTAKQTTAETTAAPSATAGSSAAAVPKLLQFSAPLVSGGQFAGADQAGRATAFWFWAPT